LNTSSTSLHVGLALERALVDDLLQQLLEQRRTGRAQQRVDPAKLHLAHQDVKHREAHHGVGHAQRVESSVVGKRHEALAVEQRLRRPQLLLGLAGELGHNLVEAERRLDLEAG
jgi:hypothetical protein